jgi:DNA-binding MarR family transcriptional regulator
MHRGPVKCLADRCHDNKLILKARRVESEMELSFRVFPLHESPGYLIYRTAARLKAELSSAFHRSGHSVTPEQWAVLSRLWENDGEHQTVLAERATKDRHNMTRILNLLERNGFVRREADPDDKRCHRVYLTDAGRSLKDVLIPIVEEHLHRALAGLTQDDLSRLKRMHERIVENVATPLAR